MKKYGVALGVLSVFTVHADEPTLQAHEQWWEKNLTYKMGEFDGWLGDEDAHSRCVMHEYIKARGYASLLDVPCGLCTEFFGHAKHGVSLEYYGLDITPRLVTRAWELGLRVRQGSIEAMPYSDNFVDVCYARHILEHLDYYERALDELIRVAKKEVLVVFFIKPTDEPDRIDPAMIDGALLYHNTYNRTKLIDYVRRNPKVVSFAWQTINDKEEALHIYVGEHIDEL